MVLGADPLLATRLASFACAAGIVVLLYREARLGGAAWASSALFAACFVSATGVAALSMVGLETVMFAFALLLSFHGAHRFARSGRSLDLVLSNATGFGALLLRPEALLLTGVLWLFLLKAKAPGGRLRFALRELSPTFVLPLFLYVAWKLVTFGSILPNAFYVKVASVGLFSELGVASVLGFVSMHTVPLAAALLSLLVPRDRSWLRAAAAVFALSYALFYLRVDTLMDVHGRFLFPVAPFVWLLALPVVTLLFETILRLPRSAALRVGLVLACVLLLFSPRPLVLVSRLTRAAKGISRHADPAALMQREAALGRALARYPGIRELRIAVGDAGVIPYLSGAKHLDVVGLNDPVIARGGDLARLTEHFFEMRPDLVLHPANKNHTWIRYGHGALGDYAAWSRDPRWDDYAYVGTVKTSGAIYDLHLLVRRDRPDFDALTRFLRREAVDRVYPVLPLALGSYKPSRAVPSRARSG